MSWTAIQLGSREHFAVPVALCSREVLDSLITDVWLSEAASRFICPFSPSLAGRRSDTLPMAKVHSNTIGRLLIDFRLKRQRKTGWGTILERNEWFGAWAARESAIVGSSTVYSYSYTARLPFADASKRGARCILGQIDPGPREEDVVMGATGDYRHLAPPDERIPQKYWDSWREEIAMADKIIVNSPWSAKLLVEAGVPAEKLVEIPLVYERADSAGDEWRVTSDESRRKKPNPRLQALFLGSVILRKGVGQLFDAIRMLKNEPVDFTFAGPIGVKIPDDVARMPNVRFLGPVVKATAEKLYRESDVFLFPTLSDGFGLTQLEALGHGLPVVASTNCGQVVEHRVNGLLLPKVSPETIAEAIMELVRDRDLLGKLEASARVPDKCHPRHLAPALLATEKT